MLFNVLIVFHVIVAVTLILVVLLQSSKGEALAGSAFGGGGGGGASFGQTRGSALSKATTVFAFLFMITCILLTFMSAERAGITAAPGDADAESVVTESMQKEMERQQAAQQQFQDQTGASDSLGLDSLLNIEPGEAAPQDTSGGGN